MVINRLTNLAFSLLIFFAPASLFAANGIGDAMVLHLESRIGTRLGGGECAHMATEALRVSGGEFFPADLGPDSPGRGDYVWGDLVTTISISSKVWRDSNPTISVEPGDIIQFGSAKIGGLSFPTKHTAVVRTVNSAVAARPATILHQNFGGNRTVQSATIDLTKLTAGWVRIYRPRTRIDTPNVWKLTVVNNTTTTAYYDIMIGTTKASSLSLSAANSAGSFRIHRISTSGTVPALVVPTTKASVFVETAKANRTTGSPVVIEQILD